MSDVLRLSATALARAIADSEISSAEATQAYLDAIDAHDTQLHCFNEVLAERAMNQARAVDEKRARNQPLGPLAGVPMAIKDNLCTTYGRTTCSSRTLEQFVSPYTATAVAKLEAADAIVLGKTNLDEFAMGSSTENSAFGVTRNPWDTERVSGGSSGGSAAAVAARLCAAAVGSDTGGSIRQPSAFCGMVGLKPTYGRVSRYGLVAFGSSLDQIGPMTRDVADAAALLEVISGHDPADSTSLPVEVPKWSQSVAKPIENLRIGLPREFFAEGLDPAIGRMLRDRAATMEKNGATLVDVDLPHSRIDRTDDGELSSFAVAAYYVVCMAEASSNLARYDSVHYGHRTGEKVDDIVQLYSRSRAEGFGDEVKRRIMLGAFALSAGYYDAYYNKALQVRRLIRNDFDAALGKCDVLLCPATPSTAFGIGEKVDDPVQMYLADIYTISLNLAGLPGISIPAGLSDENLPVGLQLVGPALGEDKLLRAARMFEEAIGFAEQPSVCAS
jgi:aspartyl-tRNA(Asn)/glutamyl-tRNA(Gln) amidotransferase subunit A